MHDATRYARLAKMLPTTYREEAVSASLQTSNSQGNDRDDLVKEGLISAEDAGMRQELGTHGTV